ncbi:DUF4272 domain-containing protein [Acidovorax sp.]|uniref:DUF4272 domain-containing protein n=1 Tax=Acidovorax sp. TaxID=1872122 RepID=UPI0026082EF0|nr:DUF4272 domain-containing protein [Acidovorax sp.]
MLPQDRKTSSEELLRTHNVSVNAYLPLIESEDEVELRSADELLHRLIALWSVVDKAFLREESKTAEYIAAHRMQAYLSEKERQFLFAESPTDQDTIHFSWQLEALYFVAWCAGLLEIAALPDEESSVKPILPLFPSGLEPPDRLRREIRPRGVSEVLDRADLMYRLHWAVRDARLNGAPPLNGINGGVVQEWHRAVNWMIRYDGENNWDQVGTDT